VLGALVGHKDALTSVSYSPDGRRLATTSFDGTVRFWSPNTGKLLSTVQGTSFGALWDIAFSPDGKEFATADEDTTVKLWDTSSRQELLRLTGATRGVQEVAFSPDGTRLAAASADGTVRVYILPLGELMDAARARLTRSWTPAECLQFLNANRCPPTP
jgi:WD40 repeat protein